MKKVGHPRGLKLSEDHKAKIGKGLKNAWDKGKRTPPQEGVKAPHWLGDKAKPASIYCRVHRWVERQLGKPLICEHCEREVETTRLIHWANISKEYKYDVSDWARLCTFCHKRYDLGRIEL